jgi:hypothetical protein
MLITQSTAEAWFRKDSFIYLQYIFLFRNPLWWKKREPQGASLCPYFWMAMFSFFIVKPLVYLLVYTGRLLEPLFILGGRPIAAIDRMLGSLFFKNLGSQPPGACVGFLLLALAGICGIVGLVMIISTGVYQWYHALELPLFKFIFWGIISGVTVLCVVAKHYSINRYRADRCKSEVYIYIWAAIITAISAIGYTSEYIDMWRYIGLFFPLLFSGVYSGIIWLAGVFWSGVKYCAGIVWAGAIAGTDAYHIPYWVIALIGLVITSALGYTIERLAHLDSRGKVTYRKAWTQLLHKAFGRYICTTIKNYLRHVNWESQFKTAVYNRLDGQAYTNLAIRFTDNFIASSYAKFLNAHEAHSVPLTLWMKMDGGLDKHEDNGVRIASILDIAYSNIGKYLKYEAIGAFMDRRIKSSDIQSLLIAEIQQQEYAAKLFASKEEAKRNAVSTKLCRAFTAKLYNVIATAKHHSGVAWDYGIRLLKARKQGACPYIRFENIKTK